MFVVFSEFLFGWWQLTTGLVASGCYCQAAFTHWFPFLHDNNYTLTALIQLRIVFFSRECALPSVLHTNATHHHACITTACWILFHTATLPSNPLLLLATTAEAAISQLPRTNQSGIFLSVGQLRWRFRKCGLQGKFHC